LGKAILNIVACPHSRSLKSLGRIAIPSMLVFPVSSSRFIDNSIIGDFSSVSEIKPQVVINFIGDCVGKSIDTSSCVVSKLIADTFGNEKWGYRCVPFGDSEAVSMVTSAFNACNDDNADGRDDLINVLSSTLCFSKICEEYSHLEIESTWLRTCAKVNLPYSQEQMDGIFSIIPDVEDVILSCMLREAMKSPPSDFGLNNHFDTSIESCYPPGYPMTAAVCANNLAPVLFSRCTTGATLYDSTLMSMITTYVANAEDLTLDFCATMAALSGRDSLKCLVPLCDYTPPIITGAGPTVPPRSPSVESTRGAPTITPTARSPTSKTPASSTPTSTSAQPTNHQVVQSTVVTEVFSEFTLLGIDVEDVASTNLKDFFECLSNAVVSVVLNDVHGEITVNILVLGGVEIRRLRQLQGNNTLDVEFKAKIVTQCFLLDCSDIAAAIAGSFKTG
jgi:hypothetical protein